LENWVLKIGFEKIATMNLILVLGIAGGSVIKTLVHEVGYAYKITRVEIDSSVISIANTYFELAKISNFDLVLSDAFEFVLKTKVPYNLIIITIFRETKMPNFFFEKFFCKSNFRNFNPK
jgi:spermidine synthase